MKVSVIIATYNYGQFLENCLRSVLNQTLADWECIIIDDASTDATESIVKQIVEEDKRFKYERLNKNGGVSAARNRGLVVARGEYIQFLDADDAIAPQKLEIQTRFLDQNPDVDLVYSDFFHFDAAINFNSVGEYSSGEKISGNGQPIIARFLKGNFIRLNTVLFRRHLTGQIGFFTELFVAVEDLDYWLRMACYGVRFFYFDDPLAISAVRVNPNGLSKNIPVMRKYYLPVLQSALGSGQLNLLNTIRLLLRYEFVMLDKKIFLREPVLITDLAIVKLLAFIVIFTIPLLPFFLIYKFIRLFR